MQKRVPIVMAAILTACGAAATSSDNSADAKQSAQPGGDDQQAELDAYIKEALEMESAVQNGGVPGCFDPSLSGRERAVAERLGGVPCEEESKQTTTDGDRWPGAYSGLEIAAAGPNRYSVRLEIGAPGCGGEIKGTASGSGNRLVMRVPPPVPGGYRQCRLDLEHRGASVRVTSDGDCYLFHGAQCEGFDGDYPRTHSASAAPTARSMSVPSARAATQSASWIVGNWVLAGSGCNGPMGITYKADGTYTTNMDTGRWQLVGNTLTHTPMQAYAEDGSPYRIANPQSSRSEVISRTRDVFTHRSDLAAVQLQRCS